MTVNISKLHFLNSFDDSQNFSGTVKLYLKTNLSLNIHQ